jgi:hypothetical protein
MLIGAQQFYQSGKKLFFKSMFQSLLSAFSIGITCRSSKNLLQFEGVLLADDRSCQVPQAKGVTEMGVNFNGQNQYCVQKGQFLNQWGRLSKFLVVFTANHLVCLHSKDHMNWGRCVDCCNVLQIILSKHEKLRFSDRNLPPPCAEDVRGINH